MMPRAAERPFVGAHDEVAGIDRGSARESFLQAWEEMLSGLLRPRSYFPAVWNAGWVHDLSCHDAKARGLPYLEDAQVPHNGPWAAGKAGQQPSYGHPD